MRIASGWRRVVALAGLATLIAGCDPTVAESFATGVEALPGPGYFHIEGDPSVAPRDLVLRYLRSDGALSGVSDTVRAGERVAVDRTTFPGTVRLTLAAVACSGSFAVELDRETDVLVRLSAEGCETSVVRTHEPGAIIH